MLAAPAGDRGVVAAQQHLGDGQPAELARAGVVRIFEPPLGAERLVDGALAGIIMPASPQVGMTYREEYYAGHAQDGASIIGTDALAEVPYGRFEHCVQTRNFSGIEPDVIEEKLYDEGVGVVLELTVSGGSDRAELLSYTEG